MQIQPVLSRLFCLVVGLLIILTACDSNESPQSSSSEDNSQKNVALVQKFIDAQMEGDAETMRSLVNNDFLARNPAGDTLTIEEFVENWMTLNKVRTNQDAGVFATNTQNVATGALAGEGVMFWGTYTAEIIKSQESMEVLWHADFMIKDGKISRSVAYFDMIDTDDSDSGR